MGVLIVGNLVVVVLVLALLALALHVLQRYEKGAGAAFPDRPARVALDARPPLDRELDVEVGA